MTAAPSPRGWLLQTWGEEAVAYDAASGDTHYLSAFTRTLFETCRDHPGLTAVDLAVRLAPHEPALSDTELRHAIDEGLASLSRIGLLNAS